MKDFKLRDLSKITVEEMDRIYKNLGITFLIRDGKIKGFGAEVKDKNGKNGSV